MNSEIAVVEKKFTDWMNESVKAEGSFETGIQLSKRLKLADGESLSIQAHHGAYCSPRANSSTGDFDEYLEFEIGFPSVEIEEIMKFAEDPSDPTQTVYGYVPKEIIKNLIESRGGVVGFDN